MSDKPQARFSNNGPGTPTGSTLPVAGKNIAPRSIDVGGVEQGRVAFENWKGAADRPEPEPPAILAPEKRLGLAIVGLGRLTLNQILPALRQSLYARPVALVSDRAEKAEVVANQYGIRESAVYRYDEIDRLADNPEIDAVYIVTPNGRHLDHVLAAAKAGKHILCEKPMANNSSEAREMVQACKQAGVRLMIAYRCQYELFNVEAARLTQSGELGRPRIIHATNTQVQGSGDQWRMSAEMAGGGALPDIGLYCLNGVRTMLGEDPIEVYAQIVNPEGDERYAEVEETVSFTLRFKSGVIANCVTSYGAHECKDMEIRLEKGSIALENAFAYQGQRLYVSQRHGEGEQVNEIRLAAKNQFTLEIDHFAAGVLNNQSFNTPGEEGLQDHLLMEAIYKSAREGVPVKIEHTSIHSPASISDRL